MVRYEVTLNVKKNIEPEFESWLEKHVKEMLEFKGFSRASIHKNLAGNKDESIITVNYIIHNINYLKLYFKYNSEKMRQDGINNFPHGFTASRKIYNNEVEVNLEALNVL